MYRLKISLISLAATTGLAFLPAVSASAQVTVTTTPYVGLVTETFEGFPNLNNGGTYGAPNNTQNIFGGVGTVSSTGDYAVYEAGVADYPISSGVLAGVSDGTKALVTTDSGRPIIISLTASQTSFGGFFNASGDTGTSNVDLTFDFSLGASAVGSSSQTINVNNGALSFLGFTSVLPFDTVTITPTTLPSLVFADGLRIGVVAVPEVGAGWLALAGLPVAVAVLCRRLTK